ncbi:MmcQ/YjbR family DNA-binding protein [Pseudonocardia sp. N23]|uniref:MmcQ/YjbR family DNA-binding protein n=1 Tax=Pseudonocardia sp. N23 TaxID=1987376 RepID=UPI000C0274A3|nr:MmcQ/YjbR family DNA-binding protein [Pseudonocardia sp. N23]GAY11075.1 hypothetical protein TOK_5561 [Pseudonocardia sp. N23]
MDWDDVVRIGTGLPEVEESTSYRTPALKVRGTLMVRLRAEEDGLLVVMCAMEEKEAMLASGDPTFSTTPHYDGHGSILVDLTRIGSSQLTELITEAWRLKAPRAAAVGPRGLSDVRRIRRTRCSDPSDSSDGSARNPGSDGRRGGGVGSRGKRMSNSPGQWPQNPPPGGPGQPGPGQYPGQPSPPQQYPGQQYGDPRYGQQPGGQQYGGQYGGPQQGGRPYGGQPYPGQQYGGPGQGPGGQPPQHGAPARAAPKGSPGAAPGPGMIFAIITVVGGLLAAVGSFLPWVTLQAGTFGSLSVAGTEGDGIITLIVGILIVAVGVLRLLKPSIPALVQRVPILLGLIVVGLGVYVIINLNSTMAEAGAATGGLAGELADAFDFSLGFGLIMTIVGGVVAVVGGIVVSKASAPAVPPGVAGYPPAGY